MQPEQITTEEVNLNESFEKIPEEVEDFMWSDAYTIILEGIQNALHLTDDQREHVRILSYDILTGVKSMSDVAVELSKDIQPDLIAKILYAIDSEIINRATNIAEFYTEDEDTSESDIAKKQIEVQTQYTQTYNRPTTLTPTKRVLTNLPKESNTPTTAAPITPSTTSPSPTPPRFDPYRENPNEK